MARATTFKVTIGEGGTVSSDHNTGTQLMAAVVTPDPADESAEGGVKFAVVAWNSGKKITVKGTPGSKQIVTCLPAPNGPPPDNSAAPTFA